MRRHAHQEAIGHATKGLELLHTLPATPERTQQELSLHMTLGAPLIATQGWSAPQVGQVYIRANALCQQSGTLLQRFPVLRGLQVFYMTRAEFEPARQQAEQLLVLARQLHDPALLVGAHQALGQVQFFLGEFALARAHLEQGLALSPQQHYYQSWPGGHPRIQCLGYAAWTLWFLGYPDQALKMGQEALALAKDVAHPFSFAMALQFIVHLHQVRREVQAAQEHAEENITFSTAQGFTSLVSIVTLAHSWAVAKQGQREEGVMQMNQVLSVLRIAKMDFVRPFFLAALAEVYGDMGQPNAGLRPLTEALALVAENGGRFYEGELYRLRGELMLQQAINTAAHSLMPDAQGEAEACFHQALDITRRQQTKLLELRAAVSLARLWQQQGKRQEAKALLTPIYGWFTEGFDTADLQEARAVLDAVV